MTLTQTLPIIGGALLALLWVIHRVRVAAHKTSPAELDAAMRRHPAGSECESSPFTRRPIPGEWVPIDPTHEGTGEYAGWVGGYITTEHVTPLDPAGLPTVTTDDEALEAMRRLALEDLTAEIEQRVKDAIEKKEKGQ